MLHLWIVLQLAGASEVFADVPTDPRLDRLQAWVTAVERHEPGSIDGPAAVLRWWGRTALADVHDDMFALSTLIADPGARVQLYEPPTPTQARRPKLDTPRTRWRGCASSRTVSRGTTPSPIF